MGLSTADAAVTVIEEALLARIKSMRRIEDDTQHLARAVVMFIENSTVVPSVSQLTREFGISDRKLRRIFEEAVGISPKAFSRTVRLRRLVALMRQQRRVNWPSAAIEAGYYDQSHMINEFRRMTGQTPAGFSLELISTP
jgi:methylphosphotriester-DNA--protein-cysteine methyltransferase